MTATFSAPHFNDDEAAREFLERLLWPDGPVCRHCGTINRAYKTKRPGVYRCAEKLCRKDFSVTKGTVLERSHIALHKWLQAFYLVASSKKGISAHQLHRTLGIGYEAAWFMEHRIREAMRDGGLAPLESNQQPSQGDHFSSPAPFKSVAIRTSENSRIFAQFWQTNINAGAIPPGIT